MKVGLIHPFYTYDESKSNRPFPFGIAYIANYVIQNGHKAEILDLNSDYMNSQQIIEAIKNMNCDVVGISSLSGGFTYVKNLISLIKKNINLPVIVGGPLGTHNPDTVLNYTKADICVIGQGEQITLDILNNINSLSCIKGIVYKDKNGNVIHNEEDLIPNLDEIPWPAYHIMDVENYIWDEISPDFDSKRRYKKGMRIAQIITGRGCPMECRFCSKVLGRKFLIRSVDDVIEEIKFLIKEYKINGISFRDELYLMNKKRAYELAAKLKPLNIIWVGQARVDRVDYELIKYMKECGCISLGFGIESGSPKMLKLMNKGQTTEQVETAIKSCQKLDMDMKVQLVMGYPGEDRDTIEETVRLFKRVGHTGRRFHLITPLPGSALYEDLIKKGVIKDELKYLTELSKREAGFSKGLPLINLTDFSDEELYRIKIETENRMIANYRKYLIRHPREIFRYFRDRLIYKKYLFNPMLIINKLPQKLGLFNEVHRENQDKIKWLEYQLE